MTPYKAAAVQGTPVFLDTSATVERARMLIKESASNGARLIVFPETFVPGYPDWVWRTNPWQRGDWFAQLQREAIVVPSDVTDLLGEAAREAEALVAIGINERDPKGSTLYNSLLYFGPDGSILGKHRKLIPTGGERLVWGQGDGSTLGVFESDLGRVGGLICWENYMPLARYTIYAQGADVYLAPTWDNSDTWVPSMQHIAKEGRLYVIGVSPCVRGSDIPNNLAGRDDIYAGEEDWLSRGNSVIVGPDGSVLAGPLRDTEGIVYAEIDVDRARSARQQFDPVGHYSRPDVFSLTVDRRRKEAIDFHDERDPLL